MRLASARIIVRKLAHAVAVAAATSSGCLIVSTSGDPPSGPSGVHSGEWLRCTVALWCGSAERTEHEDPGCDDIVAEREDELEAECVHAATAGGCDGYLCSVHCEGTGVACVVLTD